MKNVLSLSGGKDSTAMLLLMLERGEDIAAVAYFDTGWDFPEIREHIDKLEAYIGQKIVRLRPRQSFDDMLTRLPYRARKEGLDEVGYGWPASYRRWCTAYKVQALDAFTNALTFRYGPLAKCIGLAADEEARVKRHKSKLKYVSLRYPLVEYGVTEADALSVCKRHGFFAGGVYDHFARVSCFCCPLQGRQDLLTLYKYYPDLWQRLEEMDAAIAPGHRHKGFMLKKPLSVLKEEFEQIVNSTKEQT